MRQHTTGIHSARAGVSRPVTNKQTMSLAARLTMQQTAARLFLRPTQSQSTLAIRRIVARTLSTSPARLYAEHAHNHSHSVASASSSSDNYVNPYKGQSALDKAVHLFFFTEILRGKLKIMHPGPVSNLDIFFGFKACGLSWNRFSDLHTPLCTHLKRVHYPPVSVGNTP